jgi:hypothetical protein
MRIVIKGRHPNKGKPTEPIYAGTLGGKLPTLKSRKNMRKFCVRLGRFSKNLNIYHKIYPLWMEEDPISVMRARPVRKKIRIKKRNGGR